MNGEVEIHVLSAILTAVFLIGGATITLIGSLGLLRLRTFYERVHAPTLGTTLGTACVAVASMIYFSMLETRPVMHEILIVVFIMITTPVSLTILVRAALLRDQFENNDQATAQNENPPSTRP